MENNSEISIQPSEKKEKKSLLSAIIQSTSILLTVFALVYAIRNRSISDFIKYGIYIDCTTLIIATIIILVSIIKSGFTIPSKLEIVLGLLMALVSLPLMAIIYYSIGVSVKDLYYWILSP